MIVLGDDPRDLLPLDSAASGAVERGTIVMASRHGETLVPELPEGRRVVLTTERGRLELTTSATLRPGIEVAGTYLDQRDWEALPSYVKPQLRLYRRYKDWFAKVRTAAGLFAAFTGGFAVLAVAFAAWFALAGETGPTSAQTAASARAVLDWASVPAEPLAASSTPAQVAAVRRVLFARRSRARSCLEQLGGNDGPSTTVAGVTCTASSPPLFKDKDNAAVIAGVLGLLSGLCAAAGLVARFGFRRNPVAI